MRLQLQQERYVAKVFEGIKKLTNFYSFVKITENVFHGLDVIVDVTGTYGNHNYSGRVLNITSSNIFVQGLGACQLLVRDSWREVETLFTQSLTS